MNIPVENLNPVLRAYFKCKAGRSGVLLLLRSGGFLDAYGEDAELFARVAGVYLTGRDIDGCKELLAQSGVSIESSGKFLSRLTEAGYDFVICDYKPGVGLVD